MRYLAVILVLVFGLSSCTPKSEYEGYSVTKTGLDYKIHSIGNPNELPQDSNIVVVELLISTLTDSVVYQAERTFLYRVNQDTSWNEFMGLLAVGDSASAIFSSEKVKLLGVQHPAKAVKVNMVILKLEPYKDWAFYQKYPELLVDLEIEEQVNLQRVLKTFELDSMEYHNGIFVVNQIMGTGNFPQSGDELTVHYSTRTARKKQIDSTIERNRPFVFVLGVQDQVLEGFDIGIRKMKEGGKATFIVPSSKAFGMSGSSTGLAKGYETLIFEVELIQIDRKLN